LAAAPQLEVGTDLPFTGPLSGGVRRAVEALFGRFMAVGLSPGTSGEIGPSSLPGRAQAEPGLGDEAAVYAARYLDVKVMDGRARIGACMDG
jgi:hypothetical protein